MLPENGKVLDIGIGEGRNALFFAKQGFAVEGIDISETAVERCLELSKEESIAFKRHSEDIWDIFFDFKGYGIKNISPENELTLEPFGTNMLRNLR